MSKWTAIKPRKELLCGMFRDPKFSDSRHYKIYVGKKAALDKLAETLVADFPPQSLTEYPDAMALGLKQHYRAKAAAGTAAKVGYIEMYINNDGKKVIASSSCYYPKDNVDRKNIHGINPGLWEARILEHLRDAENVTHMTTTDGYCQHIDGRNPRMTSQNRRNQLVARGINPIRVYEIDEWIKKLGSKPDYSRVNGRLRTFAASLTSFLKPKAKA